MLVGNEILDIIQTHVKEIVLVRHTSHLINTYKLPRPVSEYNGPVSGFDGPWL